MASSRRPKIRKTRLDALNLQIDPAAARESKHDRAGRLLVGDEGDRQERKDGIVRPLANALRLHLENAVE